MSNLVTDQRELVKKRLTELSETEVALSTLESENKAVLDKIKELKKQKTVLENEISRTVLEHGQQILTRDKAVFPIADGVYNINKVVSTTPIYTGDFKGLAPLAERFPGLVDFKLSATAAKAAAKNFGDELAQFGVKMEVCEKVSIIRK